ncbi:hypothetical protein J7E29_02685 [Streptomyces sp. ISL-90]|nr:hypothetical protein [Streptomyces sp. ISL-90]
MIMADFVDPIKEPLKTHLDRDADAPLDPDLDNDDVLTSAEADRRAAAAGTKPEDGTEVTSASEGDPLDDTTPVDNLE